MWRGSVKGAWRLRRAAMMDSDMTPIFLVGEKTYAELTPAEKDVVSHRGKALRELAARLEERHGN